MRSKYDEFLHIGMEGDQIGMEGDQTEQSGNVVPLFPNSTENIISKAKETAEAGDYDAALSYLATAIEQNRDDVSKQAMALAARGHIHMSMGNYQAAEQDFRDSRTQLLAVQEELDDEKSQELEKIINDIAQSEENAKRKLIEQEKNQKPDVKDTPA